MSFAAYTCKTRLASSAEQTLALYLQASDWGEDSLMFNSGDRLWCYACGDVLCRYLQTSPHGGKPWKRKYVSAFYYPSAEQLPLREQKMYLALHWQPPPWLHLCWSARPCLSSWTRGSACHRVFSHAEPTPGPRSQRQHTPHPLQATQRHSVTAPRPSDHTGSVKHAAWRWLTHLKTGWLWQLPPSLAWQHGALWWPWGWRKWVCPPEWCALWV